MSCCGGRRQAHKAWLASRPVAVRFVGNGTGRVVGKVTGKLYEFSEGCRELAVDFVDAQGLLRGGDYRRVLSSA